VTAYQYRLHSENLSMRILTMDLKGWTFLNIENQFDKDKCWKLYKKKRDHLKLLVKKLIAQVGFWKLCNLIMVICKIILFCLLEDKLSRKTHSSDHMDSETLTECIQTPPRYLLPHNLDLTQPRHILTISRQDPIPNFYVSSSSLCLEESSCVFVY